METDDVAGYASVTDSRYWSNVLDPLASKSSCFGGNLLTNSLS
jgi:hypothetical protein